MSTNHMCPRCEVALQKSEATDMYFNTIEIESCPSCEGKLIPEAQLDFLSKEYDVVLLEFRKIPPLPDQLKELTCPHCGKNQSLEKVVHPRDAKVILDICPTCKSVWLDSGELEAIQKDDIFALATKLYRWALSRD